MILTIDTSQPLSAQDRSALRGLLDMAAVLEVSIPGFGAASSIAASVAEPAVEDKPAPKKRTSKKATPKPASGGAQPQDAPADPIAPSDAPSLKDAVDLASKLIAEGESDKVRAALAAVGATRVSGIDEAAVPAFLAALDAA